MREPWNNCKHSYIHITQVPNKKNREWSGKYLKNYWIKTFQSSVSYKLKDKKKKSMNPKNKKLKEKYTKHSITKLLKPSDKKSARGGKEILQIKEQK